jgi:O-antigen ligase
LQQRFIAGDNYEVAGLTLNTSGRAEIWTVVTHSLQSGDPLLGRGPGSAELALAGAGIEDHPHNDYLRIAHDFGYLGLVLFVAGCLWLMARSFKAAQQSPEDQSAVHWSSLLALAAVTSAAVTDNVLVYGFVMVPLGVVVGMSAACLKQPSQEPPPPSGLGRSPRTAETNATPGAVDG